MYKLPFAPPPPMARATPLCDGELLGRGSFSTVYKSTWHGMQVAIKDFNPQETTTQKTVDRAIAFAEHEIAIYSQLRHPHIVTFYGALPGEPRAIIMELMTHCLCELITQRPYRLIERDEACVATQIASALEFIHSNKIIHCDIKSDNIFVKEGVAKLGDFGLAKNADADPHGSQRGTLEWMAPELRTKAYLNSETTDIFAYGVTLWEIYTQGKQPSVTAINSFRITPLEKPSLIAQVITACLHPNPIQRYHAGRLVYELQQFCISLGINPQIYRINVD